MLVCLYVNVVYLITSQTWRYYSNVNPHSLITNLELSRIYELQCEDLGKDYWKRNMEWDYDFEELIRVNYKKRSKLHSEWAHSQLKCVFY